MKKAFTLVEMLLALLIVSVILSASIPVITKRINERTVVYNEYSGVPIGMIAIWGTNKPLPDNTWLECNGQAIPAGIEYEEIRQIYGSNLPDYRGMFLRGYGKEIAHTQNNGTNNGVTTTYHSSGEIGAPQGDSIREAVGNLYIHHFYLGDASGLFTLITEPRYTLFSPSANPTTSVPNPTYSFTSLVMSNQYPTSNEIRPLNKAVRFIIKVKD